MTRDDQAQVALALMIRCWARGFVLFQKDGFVLAMGHNPTEAPRVRAAVAKFQDLLLPRTPTL